MPILKSCAEQLHHLLLQKNKTLALAESCTGGKAASSLTVHPGASLYFQGGVIAYSAKAKEVLLGIPHSLATTECGVSRETAIAMAESALTLFSSDYSLATTGFAGPGGGTVNSPVGTVWCALAMRGKKTEAWLLLLQGSREEIIEEACFYLFNRLVHKLRVSESSPLTD